MILAFVRWPTGLVSQEPAIETPVKEGVEHQHTNLQQLRIASAYLLQQENHDIVEKKKSAILNTELIHLR